MRNITKLELAQWMPNKRGGRGVHPQSIGRMVKRGELPNYDFQFSNGVAGWHGDGGASDPRIRPFIPETRFLRPKQVCERTGLRYRQLTYLESRGQFPLRRRLTTRLVGWVESEIDAWLASRQLASAVTTDLVRIRRANNERKRKKKTGRRARTRTKKTRRSRGA